MPKDFFEGMRGSVRMSKIKLLREIDARQGYDGKRSLPILLEESERDTGESVAPAFYSSYRGVLERYDSQSQ